MSLAGATRVDANTRTGLGWLLGARLLLSGLSLGLAVSIDRVEASPGGTAIWGVYWAIVGAFMATIVSATMINRTRDPARFAMLQVGIDVTIVTALVYFSGGGDSVFTFLYAIVVLYGALFLDRAGVGLSCALASVGYGLVLFGSEMGLLPVLGFEQTNRPLPLLGAYWVFYTGALLVLGMLANTLSAELRRTGAALDRQTTDLQRLRDLHLRTVESIGSGLLTTNELGVVTSFNPEAERLTGLRVADAVGRPLDELIPGATAIVSDRSGDRGLVKSVGRDRLPYCNERDDDLFLGMAASGLIDVNGRQVGHVVIFQDVTDVVSMEQDLRQSERLAAVGEMAARMAHEIRNPLASISGSVQVLQSSPADSATGDKDPEHDRLMGIVVREVDRLNHLIGDFLRYSRPTPTKTSAVNLSALIEEVAAIFQSQSQFDGTSSIELDLDPKVIVMADPDQLKAVIWNLWNNAMESMTPGSGTEGGCLSTRLLSAPGDSAQAQLGLDRNEKYGGSASSGSARGHAVLEIEDTGCGIPEAVQKQIFEPFFTTKRDGTGLGLATVQRLIEQQGGSIHVSSLEGTGTTFRVRLRIAEDEHGIA